MTLRALYQFLAFVLGLSTLFGSIPPNWAQQPPSPNNEAPVSVQASLPQAAPAAITDTSIPRRPPGRPL